MRHTRRRLSLPKRGARHEHAHKRTTLDARSGDDLRPGARRNRRLARVTRSGSAGGLARGARRDVGPSLGLEPRATDRGARRGPAGRREQRGVRPRGCRTRPSHCEDPASFSRCAHRPRLCRPRADRRDRTGASNGRSRRISRSGTCHWDHRRLDCDESRPQRTVLCARDSKDLE